MTDITIPRDVAEQVLKALESMKTYAETVEPGLNVGVPIIAALRARLAQPEQDRQSTHSEDCWRWHHECAVAKIERLAQPGREPVGLLQEIARLHDRIKDLESDVEFLSLPAQRKPLTDDELTDLWYKQSLDWMEFARAIEAAHDIKGEA